MGASTPYELGWTQLSAGRNSACGIRAQKLYCWGGTSNGVLAAAVTGPTEITDPAVNWASVRVFPTGTCAVTDAGVVYCAGVSDLAPAGGLRPIAYDWAEVVGVGKSQNVAQSAVCGRARSGGFECTRGFGQPFGYGPSTVAVPDP